MRILVVTGTFHPEAGGPPTYLYHLLPELMARGHSIRVVTFGDPQPSHAYPYPVTRISRDRPIPLRLLDMTREVLRQGRDADLLFTSDYGLPTALANLPLRKPVVLKVVSDFAWEYSVRHGLVPAHTTMDVFQNYRFSGIRVALVRALQRAYVAAAHRIIVPSRYIASIVAGWGISSDKTHVIYNAPQLSAYDELPDKPSLRASLGYEGRVVVCVVRLTAWKGVDGVLRAVKDLRDTIQDTRLVVVGDGPERQRLEKLARTLELEDAVRFTGQLPHLEVARYLRAADVCVLFSTYEGLPHIVLEAMAAGTPVVASAAGGTPETMRDGESGLLVPVGDEAALATALAHVLADETLAAKLVEGGRAELVRFSMGDMIAQTESLLREAAGES